MDIVRTISFFLSLLVVAFFLYLYYKFFKHATPINARALNDIQFGRMGHEDILPVPDEEIKKSEAYISEIPTAKKLDGWERAPNQ